jgi:hypothetical protein
MIWTKEMILKNIAGLEQQAMQCAGAIQVLRAQLADMEKPESEQIKPEPAVTATQA